MSSLLFACKRCGAAIDAGPRAALQGPFLLDAACAECGKRALYPVPQRPAQGH